MTVEARERKGPRVNKSNKISTTFWLTPALLVRFKHRLLDLGMELGEGADEAIRQFLEAPKVTNYRVHSPVEQTLVEGIIDMHRNPRNPTETAMVQWLLTAITNR